ncbi:trypsin-like peptidase domain-containing protein [Terrabacter sp. RAF57]|uniref:trypsin-like peptidase domain-containing protein n=1 Tax=Terrabacter sp. RAF57 TaxID=3233063 RepID=UPI003F9C7F6C
MDVTTCDGRAHGTGFLVGQQLLLTNEHVIDGWTELLVELGEDGQAGTARGTVVGLDSRQDLAVIRLDHRVGGHVFTFMEGRPAVGLDVAAIGFPKDQPMSLTRGTISGTGRSIDTYSDLIQTDLALNPGNSGGPLLTAEGNVVGVAVAVRKDSEGIAFGVSSDDAAKRARDWSGRTTALGQAHCSQVPTADRTAPSSGFATPTATPTAPRSTAADSTGSCDRTLATYPILRQGSSGSEVRALQCFLNDAGLGHVVVDGQYGPQTRAAVARLKSASERPVSHSGRVNNVMWVALISRSLGPAWLREGDSGPAVRTLQRALRAAGAGIVVDGEFGPQTRAIVRTFQGVNGLISDGVVGDQTLFALKSGAVLRSAN